MNNNINSQSATRLPIATGWIVWLTWLFAFGFGSVLISFIFEITLAIFRAQPLMITLWSGVEMLLAGLFWIGCLGVLIRNHRLASMAVVLAWVLAILVIVSFTRTTIETGIDFFVHHQQVDLRGLLGILILAFMFAQFAYDIARNLRAQTTSGAASPGS